MTSPVPEGLILLLAVPPLFGEAEHAVPREGQEARSLVFMKPRHGRNVYRREHSQSHKERPAWPRTKTQISPEGDFATSSGSSLPAGSQGSCLRTTPAPFCPPVSLPVLRGESAGASPPERAPHRIWWAGCTGSQARPCEGDGPSGLSLCPPCDLGGEAWYLAPHLPSLPLTPEELPSTWGSPGWGGWWRPLESCNWTSWGSYLLAPAASQEKCL